MLVLVTGAPAGQTCVLAGSYSNRQILLSSCSAVCWHIASAANTTCWKCLLLCCLQIANFIFGNNTATGQGSEKIVMTSPVRMEIVSGWRAISSGSSNSRIATSPVRMEIVSVGGAMRTCSSRSRNSRCRSARQNHVHGSQWLTWLKQQQLCAIASAAAPPFLWHEVAVLLLQVFGNAS
jgi:hypothetical protein